MQKIVAIVGQIGTCILFLHQAGITNFVVGPTELDDFKRSGTRFVATESADWLAPHDATLIFINGLNVARRVNVDTFNLAAN